MNTQSTNPTTKANRWAPVSQMILGFVGSPLTAALIVALFFGVFAEGCKDEDPGIVNVCLAPTVIRTSPTSGAANEPLSKASGSAGSVRVAAVKIITATFSTPMDARSINAQTFLLRQGTTSIPGTVSYSDTTAYFVVANGLSPNLSYTVTLTSGVKDIVGTAMAANYVWTFSTIAPGTPTLVAPVDGAGNQAANPTLIWNAVPGADTYRLQVSTSNTFVTTVYDDSTRTNTSQQISGLNYGATYFWRVNSKISGGSSAYSNVWSFAVIGPPAAPVLVAPVNLASNQSTSPTLSWNASAGAATYRLQVSTSAVFASTVFNDSTITGTSQPITGLALGTTYYWRVNAKNVAGTSVYSARSFTTIAAGTPTLVSPLDGAVNLATNPTMIWDPPVLGANTYRLQISTSGTFATTVFDDSTIAGTSQPISGLTVGTTYYWRVNAKLFGGTSPYSSVWTFTTLGAPAAPVLVAPLNAAVNISTSPTLSWNASTGADTYRLQVSTSAVFATTFFNDSTITGTSQPMTGLAVGTTYYWRVNAKNAAGTSAYNSRDFTTITAGTPTLVAPADGAVNQAVNPTMSWNAVAGAGTYRLQVSLSPAFVSTVFNDSTIAGTSQPISGLAVGTTYYWRVNAKISGATGAYSAVWSFTTIGPPPTPVLVAPLAAAQNQPTSLTLSWLASTGAATYRLQVSTSAVFATTFFNDSTITGTSQPIAGLALGTTYYWRVNAKNVAGTSAYATRNFTTSVAALLPPILAAPADAAVNISTTPTLSWLASTGALTYRLQVDTSTVFASTVFDDSTLTGLSQLMPTLTNGKTYFWRVNAKNGGGTSAYSTTWRFTVAALPPPSVNLGMAARFGSIGGAAGITNQGILTQVNGSIGTTGASTLVTGFHDATAPPTNVFTETPLNIGAVRDTIYTATAPPGSVASEVATQSLADAQTAFNFLAGLPGGIDVATLGGGAGELGNRTLAPGVYKSAPGTYAISLGDLTLDGQGDPNARFVFQMASSLTVGIAGPTGARSVILINEAKAKNVFWVAGTGGGGAATINAAGGGTMAGTIIAYSGVTFSTAGNTTITTLEGRALGLNASVTLVNTIINVPLP